MRILPAIVLSLSLHGVACAAEVVDIEFANRMAELMQIAGRSDELEKSVSQFKSGKERGKVGAKDIGLNHMGLPKGLDASIEGANVALDQRDSIKSLEAAECAMQEHADAVHEELVGAILQLAAGLGAKPSSDASRTNAEAIATLEKLVGADEAAKTAENVIGWSHATRVPPEVFKQKAWDFITIRQKAARVIEIAERHDLTLIGVKTKLHHFSDQSVAKRRTSKMVEGTLSAVTMFGPGFGIPLGAHAMSAAWGVGMGGSENSKLLREIYYQKQLQTRSRALHNEAQLALTAYADALREKNIPLLICSETILAQLVGAVGIPQILDKPVLNHGTFAGQTL